MPASDEQVTEVVRIYDTEAAKILALPDHAVNVKATLAKIGSFRAGAEAQRHLIGDEGTELVLAAIDRFEAAVRTKTQEGD